MQTDSVQVSPFDLASSLLNVKLTDTLNTSEELTMSPAMKMLVENRDMLTLFTTTVAVLIGCVVVLVWRKSFTKKSVIKEVETMKIVVPKKEIKHEEVDDGKKKVTILYGTQTGTAEGFAKVWLTNF